MRSAGCREVPSPQSGPASGGKARTVGCQDGWMVEILFEEAGCMVRVNRGSRSPEAGAMARRSPLRTGTPPSGATAPARARDPVRSGQDAQRHPPDGSPPEPEKRDNYDRGFPRRCEIHMRFDTHACTLPAGQHREAPPLHRRARVRAAGRVLMADDATEWGDPAGSDGPLAEARIVDPMTTRLGPVAARPLGDPGADVICHG